VRRAQHVVEAEEWAIGVNRLFAEHVERGARDLPFGDRTSQGLFVDDAASGRVDEQGAALHFLERRVVEHVLRLGRERRVYRHEICTLQQLIEFD
jgi:hypothetical protein